MKKTILTTLALGTAITVGGLSDHKANASEIDYNTLAQEAKSNSSELVQHPIKQGNYDFSFVKDGFTFHFYNYNGKFGYDYHQGTDGQVENTSSILASQEQIKEQKVDKQQTQFDYQNKQDTKQVQAPVTQETKQPTQSTSTGSVKLSNGNTAGTTGSSASQQLASRTGVPASTWETIIARESNGNPNATNGQYHGILQTAPNWGDTSTVQGQIDSAVKAYKSQGLSAWGM